MSRRLRLLVPTAVPLSTNGTLYRISATGAASVWVGGTSDDTFADIVYHWGGAGFTDVSGPAGNYGANGPSDGAIWSPTGRTPIRLWHNTGGASWANPVSISGFDPFFDTYGDPYPVSGHVYLAHCHPNGTGPYGTYIYDWDGGSLTSTLLPTSGRNGPRLHGTPANLWLAGNTPSRGVRLLQVNDTAPNNYYDEPITTPGVRFSKGEDLYVVDSSAVWAAGAQRLDTEAQSHACFWQYTAAAWGSLRATEPAGAVESGLFGIDGTSSSDLWACGYWIDGAAGQYGLLYHNDGGGWTRIDIDALFDPTGTAVLNAVSARTSSDVWVAGIDGDGTMFVARYTGSTWTRVSVEP